MSESFRLVPRASKCRCMVCKTGYYINHEAVGTDDRGRTYHPVWTTSNGRSISTVRQTTCSNTRCAMYRGLTNRSAEDAEGLFRDIQHARHRRKPWEQRRRRGRKGKSKRLKR